MHQNPWKIIDKKEVYQNNWIRVDHHRVLNAKGDPSIYGTVSFKNKAIGIIALDHNHCIWLVGQYRFPLGQYSWEIPEGGGPIAQDSLESAKRELKEETGIHASSWQKIQTMHLSNSVSDEYAEIYLARELSFFQSSPEDSEVLEIQKVPFSKAFNMVLEGQITDSLSVAGILKLNYLLEHNLIS